MTHEFWYNTSEDKKTIDGKEAYMLGINNKQKENIAKRSEAPVDKVEKADELSSQDTSNTESENDKEKKKDDSASKKSKKKPLIGKKKTKAKPQKQPNGPIKKLKREDLLLLLKESMEENERLKAEVARLEEELSKRDIEILNAGSIAKAALELNGVFEAAQKAAEQYLENVKRIVDENVKY